MLARRAPQAGRRSERLPEHRKSSWLSASRQCRAAQGPVVRQGGPGVCAGEGVGSASEAPEALLATGEASSSEEEQGCSRAPVADEGSFAVEAGGRRGVGGLDRGGGCREHCPGWLEERLERRLGQGGLSAACHGSCRPPARVEGLADFLLDVQAGYGVVAAVEAG